MKREEIIKQLGGIVLKNIDLSNISASDELIKLNEERDEFEKAIYEYLVNPTEENRNNVIEEYFDEVQSALGYMEKTTGITADEAMRRYYLHEEKIKKRPRV